MKLIDSRISLSEWTDVSRNSLALGLTEVERVRAYSDAKGTTPPRETICSVVSNCAPIKIKEQSPLQETLSGKYSRFCLINNTCDKNTLHFQKFPRKLSCLLSLELQIFLTY